MRRRPGPRWPATVRARATIGAVVVVGATLALCSVALLVVLRQGHVESVRGPARARALDVAAALDRGARADRLELAEGEDRFTQVIDGGTVVAASADARDLPPLTRHEGVGSTLPLGDPDDRWLVVTAAAGDRTVVVGREIDTAVETLTPAATALAIGLPVVLAVVGATTWLVVGAALGPVEAIRTRVASIGPSDLEARVPVPRSKDEIEELALTMNDLLARLEATQRHQHRFVSDASHELRSPLATIRHHAEVARAHPDGTTTRELAEVVLAEELRLERLVADLLLLARSDEGGLGLRPRRVELDDLVLDEAHRNPTTDAEVVVDTTAVGAAAVTGDEPLLRRAVRNLLDNALRHADRRVAVSTATDDDGVAVAVHDDGPGIPPEHRGAVFDRFTRLDPARSAGDGGAGLGLAIVAEVVAAHRGRVTAGDSPLGGAAIEIRLPTGPDPAPGTPGVGSEATGTPGGAG